jgi:chemotaxis protein methyltransferase CheR
VVTLSNVQVEELEVKLLLQVLKDQYDIDYSTYRQSYIRRRIERRVSLEGLETITSLTDKVLHDSETARLLLKDISINVTDMFRCPLFFERIRNEVIPLLKTYPSIRIWHAGCSTGEEVLSMAIVLKEEGLLKRTSILATDSNEDVLEIAQKAIYPAERLRSWTENYNQARGQESFSTYYDVKYNQAKFDEGLLDRVTFKKHHLLVDSYPKNMHLIICRNVLIYFNEDHQKKVIHNFSQSLISQGYLGLGYKETIKRENEHAFQAINKHYKIFQKVKRHD